MKTRYLAVCSIFLLAACDKKSPPVGGDAPHIAGKKSSSALGAYSASAEKAPPGKAKSSERPKDEVKKPPVAQPAQGSPGKVISPFSGDPVDVSGKKPGDLVNDPKYPGDDSKRFVVPEDVEKPPIPVAQAVPGRPGFVTSPYNNQIIDVTGLPPGAMVADPTYPAAAKKHFRVPGEVLAPEAPPAPGGDSGHPPMPDR